MRAFALLVAFLLAVVRPLAAQLKSVPVYPLLAARPGWVLGLDFGSGLNDASGHARHYGARIGGRTGRLTLVAAGGAWNAGRLTSAQFGGHTTLRVLGHDSNGLALHALAGVGYTRAGPADSAATYLTVPLGMVWAPPGFRTSRGAVRPWLVSLIRFDGVSFAMARGTQVGWGLSGGVAGQLHGRLGAHAALEGVRFLERRVPGITLRRRTELTAGVGLYLSLSGGR